MIKLSLKDLKDVTNAKILNFPYDENALFLGISIDSRTIQQDNIFFALKGERFDGHDFVKDAIQKGAKGIVVKEKKAKEFKDFSKGDVFFLVVDDTKSSLGKVAKWYREKFALKTVAITGTNGKTTTKDMVAKVLEGKYSVLKSPKSYNNLVGIPLTLFQLTPEIEVLVVELGTTDLGQIGVLTEIVSPDIGVVTNIGPAHLESMRSLERIAKAKFELLDGINLEGVAILNIDDKIISEKIQKNKLKAITFGIRNRADYFAKDVRFSERGWVSFTLNDFRIDLKLLGEHNVYNALAAFAVGERLGLKKEDIKTALEKYTPSEFRMELVEIGKIRVINDSYNANPVSVKFALETLKRMENKGRKIALLGDMLELGEKSKHFHREIGKLIPQSDIDLLLTFGNLSEFIAQSAKDSNMNKTKILSFSDRGEVISYLSKNLCDGDLLLVKGSRKMELEKVVDALSLDASAKNRKI